MKPLSRLTIAAGVLATLAVSGSVIRGAEADTGASPIAGHAAASLTAGAGVAAELRTAAAAPIGCARHR